MTDQLEARAIAAQLIHNAIQNIDSTTAIDYILDAMADEPDPDTLALAAADAAHAATVYLDWDGGRRWQIQRGGEVLHTVDTLTEARTVGRLLIRTETGDRTVTIRWVCPVCDSEEDYCPVCRGDEPSRLIARGILTDEMYEIVRVDT